MTDTKFQRGQIVHTPAGRGTIERVEPNGKLIVTVHSSGSLNDWRCLTPGSLKKSTWKFQPVELKTISIA